MAARSIAPAAISFALWATPAFGAESWLDPDAADAATAAADRVPLAPLHRKRDRRFEGGLAFGASTEAWGQGAYATGPRLDAGLTLGNAWAFIVGEAARFGVGSSPSRGIMAFDLHSGLAYGAPYGARSGLGVAVFVGAERMASSANLGAITLWSATASIGLRASIEVAPTELWIGVDALVRSGAFETGSPDPIRVPTLTGVLSFGCFLPALGRGASKASM